MFNSTLLISISVFVGFAAAVWFALDLVASRKTRASERLTELKDPRKRLLDASSKKNDSMAKVLEKASPTLARPLQPKSAKEQGQLKSRLDHAGFRNEAAPGIFLSTKFVGLMIGFSIAGGAMVFTGINQASLFRIVILAGGLFYLPDIILWFLARRRKQAIFLSLPDSLDLMVVCVEAGLGLDQAMRKVAEEMKKSHRIIAEEFSIANFHLQMGKTRREVLQSLGTRTGVDDLRRWPPCSFKRRSSEPASDRPCGSKAIRCEPVGDSLRRKKQPRLPCS